MSVHCRTLLVVLAALALSASADEPIATTICDVVRAPAQYDGKMVRVRGTVLAGFEIFAVRDPASNDCRIALEYAGGGPDASTSFGGQTPVIDRPPLELRRDTAFERFRHAVDAEMFPRYRDSICTSCPRFEVTAWMSGRIDVAGERQGFGHMNAHEIRFVLAGVSHVVARDRTSEYDPEEVSPTPVRYPGGRLSGRVLDPEGKPVSRAQIDARPVDSEPPHVGDFTEWTDLKGRFSLEVPPGTYLLGMNVDKPSSEDFPFTETWYPSAPGPGSARRITVRDRQRITGLDIRLSQTLEVLRVPVRVVWPDGRPVDRANVWLTDVRKPFAVVGSSVSHTREDGSFELAAFAGVTYVAHATIYKRPFVEHCAEPQTVDTIPAEPLTLVLSRTGEACEPNR